MAQLNLTLLPKNCDGIERDVMGTVFRGCQQFSLCTVSGQSEILVMSITALLCSAAAAGSVWPPRAHSTQQFSLWPLAAGLSRGLGVLHRDSAHCCPFFDLDLVCFGDRRDVYGILSTCQSKLLWNCSQQSKMVFLSCAWTDWPVSEWRSQKKPVCVIDTGSLGQNV